MLLGKLAWKYRRLIFSANGGFTGILSYSDVVLAFSPEVRKTNSNSGAVDIRISLGDTASNTKPSSHPSVHMS
ncbi:MAG: hypothetical protein ACYYK0_01795 [Candidatus Eutrophobiaceae bacterium]